MVSVKVVDAVMEVDAVSVPTMVTTYVPFAAVGELGGGGEDVPPAQPQVAKPIAAKTHTAEKVANLRERRPNNPTKSSPAIATPACVV